MTEYRILLEPAPAVAKSTLARDQGYRRRRSCFADPTTARSFAT
jgi:hypothetical protein